MSDSLSTPWLEKYLIEAAEIHGAFLSNVPKFVKKKKVQVLDFLSYPSMSDESVWARISDKQYIISVRFNKEAMTEYNKSKNDKRRFTENRGAIVRIKDFRLFMSRVPISRGIRKMTERPQLVLDIDWVEVLGSINEPTFGEPKDVEKHKDLAEWAKGLRQDGGAGNVLKLRKEAAKALEPPIPKPSTSHHQSRLYNSTVQRTLPAKSVASKSFKPETKAVSKPNPTREYQKRWHHIRKDPWRYTLKPQEVVEKLRDITIDGDDIPPATPKPVVKPPRRHALDLDSSQPSRSPPPKEASPVPDPRPVTPLSRPTTPTVWESSPVQVPTFLPVLEDTHAEDVNEDRQENEEKNDHAGEHNEGEKQSASQVHTNPEYPDSPDRLSSPPPEPSDPPFPTLAQRSKYRPRMYSPSPPRQVHSSPPPPASLSLPLPSSLPASSSPFFPISSIPNNTLSPLALRRQINRKVPYPPHFPPPRASGPARILVPNSDTSGTASQSQPNSQPYMESQLREYSLSLGETSRKMESEAVSHRPNKVVASSEEQPADTLLPPSDTPNLGLRQPESYDGDLSKSSLDRSAHNDDELEDVATEQTILSQDIPTTVSDTVQQSNEDSETEEDVSIQDVPKNSIKAVETVRNPGPSNEQKSQVIVPDSQESVYISPPHTPVAQRIVPEKLDEDDAQTEAMMSLFPQLDPNATAPQTSTPKDQVNLCRRSVSPLFSSLARASPSHDSIAEPIPGAKLLDNVAGDRRREDKGKARAIAKESRLSGSSPHLDLNMKIRSSKGKERTSGNVEHRPLQGILRPKKRPLESAEAEQRDLKKRRVGQETEPRPKDAVQGKQKTKLAGFSVKFDDMLRSEDKDTNWMNWEDITDVLLKVGRTRYHLGAGL